MSFWATEEFVDNNLSGQINGSWREKRDGGRERLGDRDVT